MIPSNACREQFIFCYLYFLIYFYILEEMKKTVNLRRVSSMRNQKDNPPYLPQGPPGNPPYLSQIPSVNLSYLPQVASGTLPTYHRYPYLPTIGTPR